MKIFVILILGIVVVQTLGNKGPHRRSGPPVLLRRGQSSQKRQQVEKGSGWGWNGPPDYQTSSCVDPSTFPDVNWDADFFSRMRLWFWTGDTIFGYSLVSRIFLGRNVVSQDELNQMCPSQAGGDNSGIFYNFGYGRSFQQVWDSDANEFIITADPSTYDGALGVDIHAGFVTQNYYFLATDNSTYLVYYVCNDGIYGDVQLYTTRPYASPEAVAAFVAAAQQYGIPQSQLQLSQCNSAYSGPYPAPFQNYPNGDGWSNNATGWGQPPTNGWNSNPQPSGWNSASNGWSGINNGWGGHSTLAEKQSDVKAEPVTLTEEKPKA